MLATEALLQVMNRCNESRIARVALELDASRAAVARVRQLVHLHINQQQQSPKRHDLLVEAQLKHIAAVGRGKEELLGGIEHNGSDGLGKRDRCETHAGDELKELRCVQ